MNPNALLKRNHVNGSNHLSPREHEFMCLLALVKRYKEIEDEMKVSHWILRKIQKEVYRKLRAENRTEAINAWRSSYGTPWLGQAASGSTLSGTLSDATSF